MDLPTQGHLWVESILHNDWNISATIMMKGTEVSWLLSQAIRAYQDNIEKVQEELCAYAAPLCQIAGETPLPPLRAINHEIPLIDTKKIYPWRPS